MVWAVHFWEYPCAKEALGVRVSDLEEETTFMAPDEFQSEGFGSPNMRNVSGLHGMIQGLHGDL